MQSKRRHAFKRIGRKRSDVVARCHHVESCTQEERRRDSPILPWFVEHAGSTLPRCQKGRGGRTPFERLQGKTNTRVCATPGELSNRMNPRDKFGVWLGVRNNSTECLMVTPDGVFRAGEVRRIEHQNRWEKRSNQQCDRSLVENY